MALNPFDYSYPTDPEPEAPEISKLKLLRKEEIEERDNIGVVILE